jgi:cytidine deaminase
MSIATPAEAELIAAARAAMANAYAPYSHYAVGAALRLTDGNIMTGANMENASYGLSLCAEAVAIASASAAGHRGRISAIAIAGGPIDAAPAAGASAVVTPCGRCRQILNEAEQTSGRPIAILCAGAQGDALERYTLADLLPHAFGPTAAGLR